MDNTPSALTQCCVCLDEHENDIFLLPDHPICHHCLIRLFQRALDNEENYPPRLGPHVLDITMLSPTALLAPQFLAAYREKEEEYRCPLAKRLFCAWPKVSAISVLREGNDRCNTFLGQSVEKPSEVLSHGSQLVARCSKCHRFSCRACGERIEDPTAARDHKCIPLSAADAEHEAFAGLQRGKDYQICPSERCGRRVELSSGCNHIVCYCKQQFCFLCGEPAGTNSHHWEQRADGTAACPRYNQPGAVNAMFDGPYDNIMNAGRLIPPPIPYGIALARMRNPAHAGMDATRGHSHGSAAFAGFRAERDELHERARLMGPDLDDVFQLNNQGNVVERVHRPIRMRYRPVRDAEPGPSGSRRQDGQRRRSRTENDQGQQLFADGDLASQWEQERAATRAQTRAPLENNMRERESQRSELDQHFAEQRRAWEDITARADREIAERDANHQFPTFPAPPRRADNNVLLVAHNDDDGMFQFHNLLGRRNARVFLDPVPPPGFYDDDGAYNHPQPLQSNPVNELNLFQPQGFDNGNYNHPHPLQSNPVTETNAFQPQGLMTNNAAANASHSMFRGFNNLLPAPARQNAAPAPLRSNQGPAATAESFPTVTFDSTDIQTDSQARTPSPAHRFLGHAYARRMPSMRSIFQGVQEGFGFGSHPRNAQPTPSWESVEAAPARDDEPLELVHSTGRRHRRAQPVSPGFPAQSASTSRMASELAPRNADLIGQRQRMRNMRRARGPPEPTGAKGAPSPESDRAPYQTGSAGETAHSDDDP